MPYVVRCYEGKDEWGGKKWLAHLNLGNDLFMSFFGATKKEAEDKAHAWYAKEKARFEKQYVPEGFKNGDIVTVEGEKGTRVINDGWGSAPASNGWGQANVGKAWMLNRATGHRARIDASEVAKYEADGYVKAGPRSK